MSEKLALISVYDKTGLEEFAKRRDKLHFKILSTGQTAAFLKKSGLSVYEVSDYTGFSEILEGRVKTLHPKIHAGILARRSNQADAKTLADLKIDWIDLWLSICIPLKRPQPLTILILAVLLCCALPPKILNG